MTGLGGGSAAPALPRPGLPRGFDVVAAGAGLLLLAPVLVAVAVAVRLSSPGPILFRQQRIGRQGRPFTMLKFRTMRADVVGAQVTAADDPRITPVGRWLRKLKLDELPELWNVLRGDMALVGPRPEVPGLVDLEDPLWKQTLAVRPGITDPVTVALRHEEVLLAQAGGDREEYYRQVLQPAKLRGYVEYLASRSWWTDVQILQATLLAIGVPSPSRGIGLPEGSKPSPDGWRTGQR